MKMSGYLVFDLSDNKSLSGFARLLEKEITERMEKACLLDGEAQQWQFGYYTALVDVLKGINQVELSKQLTTK